MKITAPREELADALTWVAQVVSARPQHPALSGVKIATTDDGLEVSAYDYETYHAARVDAMVGDPGTILVPAHVLRDVVNAARTDDVGLVDDGTKLTVTAGRATYKIATLGLDDHPGAPRTPPRVGELDADLLAWVVDATAHAVSTDRSLVVLTGLHVVARGDSLVFEGTDRFRAARAEVPWTGDGFDVLPTIGQMTAATRGLSGTVAVHAEGDRLAFVTDRRTVVLRGLACDYPNLAPLFRAPDTDPSVIECDGAELKTALGRLLLLDSTARTPARIEADADSLAVTLVNDDHAGVEYVDATVTGPITFAVNGAYLADALPDGPVRLGLLTPTRPITVADPERPQLAQLVNPIRLSM